MSSKLDTQTIIKIYSDEEKLNVFNIFGELWSKKNELIHEIIRKRLIDELKFKEHPEDKKTIYKKIANGYNLSLDKEFSFGFVNLTYKKKMPPKIKKISKEILDDFVFGDKFFCDGDIDMSDHLVYKTVNIERVNVINNCINKFKELEKKSWKKKNMGASHNSVSDAL